MKPIYVKNGFTGGHYAFKTEKSDKPFVNNMRECKSIDILETDIVADIGAYVGEYSIYALNKGAKKVLSYEPTPETFDVLKMNINSLKNKDKSKIYNAAVVGDNSKTINLFISKGIGVTNSIVKERGKVGSIEIEAIKYEKALQDATIVKIDVEGAEYNFDILQPNLRAIILEFHPLGNDWKDRAIKIMNKIESSGFKNVIKPTFKSGWNLTGSWIKK
tara:strand:+ start:300 stop:953 length:654 start_codon:yes stop_codon:yes gene_type:complete